MICGVGVDIVNIGRIERVARNETFRARIFTAQEIDYAAGRAHAPEVYAGLFAVKEAVAKALGTGISGFTLLDIETLHSDHGGPQAVLHGGAAERMQALHAKSAHISVSHDGGLAVAFAVLEG